MSSSDVVEVDTVDAVLAVVAERELSNRHLLLLLLLLVLRRRAASPTWEERLRLAMADEITVLVACGMMNANAP